MAAFLLYQCLSLAGLAAHWHGLPTILAHAGVAFADTGVLVSIEHNVTTGFPFVGPVMLANASTYALELRSIEVRCQHRYQSVGDPLFVAVKAEVGLMSLLVH